jgi:2-polyprenyl-3-methyl-5-hydroxy-6-metoxy-1,4-benzoquinol methylase
MEKTSGLQKIYRHHHDSRDKLGMTLFEKERSEFLKSRIGQGKKILDLGCRDGVLTKCFSDGNEVLGIDIDDIALEKAREHLGIQTRVMDLNGDWDISKDYFDYVVAGEVLEHLYYPDRVLEKISVTLKASGTLLGSVPNAFSLINRFRLLFGMKKNTPLSDPTHINHFSRRDLRDLLSHNFDEVKVYPLGRFSLLDLMWPGMFSFMILFEAKAPKKSVT